MNILDIREVIDEANSPKHEGAGWTMRVFTKFGREYEIAYLYTSGSFIAGHLNNDHGDLVFIDYGTVEAISIRFC